MKTKDTSSIEISETSNERVEVLSSPGSGKTYTLVQRIKFLLAKGVLPQHILAITFSNAAVRVLNRKLDLNRTTNAQQKSTGIGHNGQKASAVSAHVSDVQVMTAHKFGMGLVRSMRNNANVLNKSEARKLLAQAVRSVRRDCVSGKLWPGSSSGARRRRLDQLKELLEKPNLKQILKLLAFTHNAQKPLEEALASYQFEGLTRFSRVLRTVDSRYTKVKKAEGCIDYNDMLTIARKVLLKNPAVVPYTHVLVDEYQDCSYAQTRMLAALVSAPDRNIMVFGDKYQAIYGFAGSSYTPLSAVLDGVCEMGLPVSKRLTKQIAALANAVAKLGPAEAIQTERDGPTPRLICNDRFTFQKRDVASTIRRLLDGGAHARDIAVLARTKALLVPIEKALMADDLLADRTGIARDTKHILRVAQLIRLVERFKGKGTKESAEHFGAFITRRKPNASEAQVKAAVSGLRRALNIHSLSGRYRICANVYLRLMGGVRRDENLRHLVNSWESMCSGIASSTDLKNAVDAMPSQRVATSTIHAAKGGEWKHVLVVGVTDGLLPNATNMNDAAAMGEERRTFYVAITRASESLSLFHSPTNHSRSQSKFEDVSMFVRNLKRLR